MEEVLALIIKPANARSFDIGFTMVAKGQLRKITPADSMVSLIVFLPSLATKILPIFL